VGEKNFHPGGTEAERAVEIRGEKEKKNTAPSLGETHRGGRGQRNGVGSRSWVDGYLFMGGREDLLFPRRAIGGRG